MAKTCLKCQAQLDDGVKFCPSCGAPIAQAQAPAQQAQNVAQAQAAMPQQKKGGSKAGLIIGIAAGGTVLLAGIIVGVVVLFSKLSAPKADGAGTALTDLLDATAATYYLDGEY